MSAVCTSKYNPIEDRRKRCLDQKRSRVMGVNNMKILIAEDDRDIRLLYSVALRVRNHHIVITHNGEECLTIYRQELKNFISRMGCLGNNEQQVFDMVVLDYEMPGINGIEVAKDIIRINPKQRIIIASAYPSETLFYSMKEMGELVELVQKPFDLSTLFDMIENKHFSDSIRLSRLGDSLLERNNGVSHSTLVPHF
jgi:CheY-like chemotaxis protein